MIRFFRPAREAIARHPNALLAGIFFGLIVGGVNLLPLVRCPWCSGEIRHFGGRMRECYGDGMGCDGSGWTSIRSRYDSLDAFGR
jgi:hypothetical protein